jgi:hypothetical protein
LALRSGRAFVSTAGRLQVGALATRQASSFEPFASTSSQEALGGSGTRIGQGGGVGRAHCSALGVRASEHLENSIASASIYSQVTKGLRWMPWRQEPMKDASGCEKLRGAAEKALIRRCPNGETRPGSCPVTQV